MVTLS